MFERPIVIGLSPNTQRRDVLLALKLLLQPARWVKGAAAGEVADWFRNYFQTKFVFTFNACRSGLLAVLKSLDCRDGDEVMIQAFTCVAVPNSVLWAKLKPIYVDCDNSLNVDVDEARKKLTPRTKVLIVQHTFGVSANMDKICAFCKEHNLILIEDCAHALGVRYHGKLSGTFGRAAVFSFGRDKVISAVFGGLVITCDEQLAVKLKDYHDKLPFPSKSWVVQQLLHPLISYLSLIFYNKLKLGKIILFLSQRIGLMSFPVDTQEKSGQQPKNYPQKFPNALACLAVAQLHRLEEFNRKRGAIVQKYCARLANLKWLEVPQKHAGTIYLRFNVLMENAESVRAFVQKEGVVLGNWYSRTIDPQGVDYRQIGYTLGSCPNAEKAAASCLNLPTYPALSNKQVERVCELIKTYGNRFNH